MKNEQLYIFSQLLISKKNYFKSQFTKTLLNNLLVEIESLKGRFLDAGCGYGVFTDKFARYDRKIIGVDIGTDFIRFANHFGNKSIIFLKGDVCKMTFRKEKFDVVISLDVIEHLNNDKKFIKEVYRILKPDGVLLLGTPNLNRLTVVMRKLLGIGYEFPKKLSNKPSILLERCDYDLKEDSSSHLREYTKKMLEDVVYSTGFKGIKTKGIWLGIPFKYFYIGIKNPPKFMENYSHYWLVRCKK